MNRFFGRDHDADKGTDPKVIDSEVRDGIEKELGRPDLTPEDRRAYEDALTKIEATIEKEDA